MSNVYDVTTFSGSVSPFTDIGTVINEIITDIKNNQTTQTTKPGAVIYIPPGHYDLLTRVNIDISHLQIKGSGHGFLSLAIRDESSTGSWVETLPGGSHIQVKNTDGNVEAFKVYRSGSPTTYGRINSVEFRDFCLDGVSASKPYTGSSKVGIWVASDNDSVRIEGMGFVYLKSAIKLTGADAAWITNNFIAECASCIELTGASQVVRVTNNYLISAWGGSSVFAEYAEGLLVEGNSLLWYGSVKLNSCTRTSITANKFVSSWPGMIKLNGSCHENLIAANQFTRVDTESSNDNGLDDLYGCVYIDGNNNTVTANHFSYNVATSLIKPTSSTTPTIILVKGGSGNFISSNRIVSNVTSKIILDSSTTGTKVLYSAESSQFTSYASSGNYQHVPIP